ncbi:hypothetical protein HDU84_005874 [Entophlyctis sp. JEL0112]|nr:hypothetical protein HDU84_005874 [Entophlyctis sp. JEL0112]
MSYRRLDATAPEDSVEMLPIPAPSADVPRQSSHDHDRSNQGRENRNKRLDAEILENPDCLPKAVWFILPSELGERFTFYGITPILKNFFKYQLGFTSHVDADMLYHVFTGFAYFTPVLGAIISDSYLDKYHTIVYFSFLYFFGLVVLTFTSWPTFMSVATTRLPRFGPLVGLLLICVGTGGIKPCVSAHGGDQFILPLQSLLIQKFYNFFYMAINTGALASSYASPAIAKMSLFPVPQSTLDEWVAAGIKPDIGNGYPAAWALLATAMLVAVVVFMAGKKFYRVVPPAGDFLLFRHASIATSYAWNSVKFRNLRAAHNYVCEAYGETIVEEMVDLVKVMFAVSPAPIFWMAFGQNGSTWQDMGDQMALPFDGDAKTSIFDSETTNNIWNPFWIIVLSPLLANYLYPWIEKHYGPDAFGLMTRMIVGQFLAGCAYVLAAITQRLVNANCIDSDHRTDTCQSSVPITILIALYFVLTLAECLFSISGLNFTYVEVGERTKSSCAAVWLTAIGWSYVPKKDRVGDDAEITK